MTSKLQLASLFPAVSDESWRNQVDALLKGKPFESLCNETSEGIRLEPLYPCDQQQRADPGQGDLRRGVQNNNAPWDTLERVLHPNPKVANRYLLDGLSRGSSALQLILQPDTYEPSIGVRVVNDEDTEQLLQGVRLEALLIVIDAGAHASCYGDALFRLAQTQNLDTPALSFYIACDPAAALVSEGSLPGESEEIYAIAAKQAQHCLDKAPRSRALGADGRPYHAAGASDAQELAAVLASALEHLRATETLGISAADAATQLLFRIALDADVFAGASKQRALRVLWQQICAECGCASASEKLIIHAETATRMLHRFDPWVNQLRSTSACLAAALGGAQLISLHGFDEVDAVPTSLGRRSARNIHQLLQQESHLHAVTDPLGGSGFVEQYTDQLVRAAWSEFQQLEREGGLIASLKAGKFQARIEATQKARQSQIALRHLALTGISEFPQLDETIVSGENIDWSAELQAARNRTNALFIELPDGAPALASPLHPAPLGEAFEALRIQASNAPQTPLLSLHTVGSQAEYALRASFANNLLAAGGVQLKSTDSSSLAQAIDAAKEYSQGVLLLCGNDNSYAEIASELCTLLASEPTLKLYLVGKPPQLKQQLSEAGVKAFLFSGMDAVALLQQIQHDLGVSS